MGGRRRYFYALSASAALSILAGSIFGQAPAQPGRSAVGVAPAPARIAPAPRPGRDRWRNMSPEDRQRFQSNIERWRQMPPAERRELRARAGWRHERLQRELEAAVRDSGLQLEAEKRAKFEERYMQERKRIEQALRQELKEKRQRQLAPVVERLKKEFELQSSATPLPRATPPLSPSPAK